ncbi:MAG: Na+/H+ antiporter NhaC family protein [Pseudomonadota bacterium]
MAATDPSAISVVPIIVTLICALVTRNVILGLFVGVLTAATLLTGPDPFAAMNALIGTYLVGQVTDSYNAAVIVLLVFIGGFVALMEHSGGGPAFAKTVARAIDTRGKAQLFTWFGGLSVFYSDLGTPLIVGPVFRPLFDRLNLSRQKLALIIDSTASPVAILIPFIGWGVYIISLIDRELSTEPDDSPGLTLFVAALPFQFYAVLALVIVPWLALRRVDFGPMADAERAAQRDQPTGRSDQTLTPFSHDRATAAFVIAPLLVMASTLLFMLVPLGFPSSPVPGSVFRSALATAYFAAALTLMILMACRRVRSLLDSVGLYLRGMNGMMQVAIVLVLAWTLSALGKELGTPDYVAALLAGGFPGWLLPAVTFLIGAIISFATGSSWGTFAILFPLVIPTAAAIEAPLPVVIAAVLSGGLFGDHCSPVSETTILSSSGASCTQYEHFRTQLPYALLNGAIALIGYLAAGLVPIDS